MNFVGSPCPDHGCMTKVTEFGCKPYLWLAGNEGMEKNMEISIVAYIGMITIRIHSFIPS